MLLNIAVNTDGLWRSEAAPFACVSHRLLLR